MAQGLVPPSSVATFPRPCFQKRTRGEEKARAGARHLSCFPGGEKVGVMAEGGDGGGGGGLTRRSLPSWRRPRFALLACSKRGGGGGGFSARMVGGGWCEGRWWLPPGSERVVLISAFFCCIFPCKYILSRPVHLAAAGRRIAFLPSELVQHRQQGEWLGWGEDTCYTGSLTCFQVPEKMSSAADVAVAAVPLRCRDLTLSPRGCWGWVAARAARGGGGLAR